LIKMADDFSDIFSGHSTWYVYSAMIRIFKRYDFSFQNPSLGAKKTAFSSYPGMLSSWDDFYMMDSNLEMLQTTISVVDNSILDLVTPNALLAWQRVRLANHLAKTGKEWYDIVKQHNSGTYNNQYMIIDYN